jgi:hypothetical protein
VPEPPLILVTNDEMASLGLHAAAEAVAGLGDLLLVAPATHAIVHDQVASATPLTWQMTAQTDWMPSVDTEEA